MSKGENIEVRGAAARLGWTMVAAMLIVLLPAGGRTAEADDSKSEKGDREVIVLEIDCNGGPPDCEFCGEFRLQINGFPWRGLGDDGFDVCERDFDLGQSGVCTADLDSIEMIVDGTNIRCDKGTRNSKGDFDHHQDYLCRDTTPKLKKLVHRICKVIMKIDSFSLPPF